MTSAGIRALIVDDELLARKFIRRLLKSDDEVEIIGECGNGKEALAAILEKKPDLVFLDVQMPEMNGFAVLEALTEEWIPAVVFVTAYDKYAIQAFEIHALDYLLKPFDPPRFALSLERAKQELRNRGNGNGPRQIAALIDIFRAKPKYLDRLIVKAAGRIILLRTEEIEWLEADDKYLHLHVGAVSHLVRTTLNAMQSQLDPQKFLRIHRSTIVNVDRIKELHPSINGDQEVILHSGAKITLSRNYRNKFYSLLGKPS